MSSARHLETDHERVKHVQPGRPKSRFPDSIERGRSGGPKWLHGRCVHNPRRKGVRPRRKKEQASADVAVMLKELAAVARSHGFEPLAEVIDAARREARSLARRKSAELHRGNRRAVSAVKPSQPEARMMAKRELTEPGTDKRYVRRGTTGRFKESDDVGRSLAADRRTKAKTVAKRGEGDKGDRRTRSR